MAPDVSSRGSAFDGSESGFGAALVVAGVRGGAGEVSFGNAPVLSGEGVVRFLLLRQADVGLARQVA